MKKIKYIVYIDKLGSEQSLMFPEHDSHVIMSKKMEAKEVLGAGFCDICIDKNSEIVVKCSGNSISLNIPSRPIKDSLRLTSDYFGFKNIIGIIR